MKVFLSWSGTRSKAMAAALRRWLPDVIQEVEPWMSDDDLEKGTVWSTALTQTLEEHTLGISCITRENVSAPWLNFEAGVIAKEISHARLWTYLLDVTYAEVTGPLALFNHTRGNKQDTLKLLDSVNTHCEKPLDRERLESQFERLWFALDAQLDEIRKAEVDAPARRTPNEMIPEILEIVRDLSNGPTTRPPFDGRKIVRSDEQDWTEVSVSSDAQQTTLPAEWFGSTYRSWLRVRIIPHATCEGHELEVTRIPNPSGDDPQGTGDRFVVRHAGPGHEWKFRVRVEKKHSTEPFAFVVHPAGITTIYAEELLYEQIRNRLDIRNQR